MDKLLPGAIRPPLPRMHCVLSAGVNFTNVLRAAFTRADPKSAKKLLNLTVFFALLGSLRGKAARRTLVKLTPIDQRGQRGRQRSFTSSKPVILNLFCGL